MAALNLKLHPRSILETSAKLSCAQQKSEVRKHWSLLLVVHAAAEAHPEKCGSSLRKENLKAATQGKAKAAKRHGLRAAAQPGQPRIPQIGPGTGPSMRTATLQSALLGAVSAPRPGQRMAPAQAFEPLGPSWSLGGLLSRASARCSSAGSLHGPAELSLTALYGVCPFGGLVKPRGSTSEKAPPPSLLPSFFDPFF